LQREARSSRIAANTVGSVAGKAHSITNPGWCHAGNRVTPVGQK
jgi:hypothetical protein